MLPSLLVFLLLQPSAALQTPAPPPHPASSFSGAADLELITDDRNSLIGVSRLAVAVHLPDTVVPILNAEAVGSTIVFQLEQAGLAVVSAPELEDSVLAITVRTVEERTGRAATGRLIYRVYADLLQLVRLSNRGDIARLMRASTWHAGSFGALPGADAASLRSRIAEVVDTFLADHRAVNPQAEPPSPAAVP